MMRTVMGWIFRVCACVRKCEFLVGVSRCGSLIIMGVWKKMLKTKRWADTKNGTILFCSYSTGGSKPDNHGYPSVDTNAYQ